MSYIIDFQNACHVPLPVNDDTLTMWVTQTLQGKINDTELTIRFVDPSEMISLNSTYRNKKAPTNVLAFPATVPENISLSHHLLGDVIICPQVLEDESRTLKKPLVLHWAHIVVHGVLHLLGYDHIQEEQACRMQHKEITILSQLGFINPYILEVNNIE